jgi:hypothetical protein
LCFAFNFDLCTDRGMSFGVQINGKERAL